MKAKLALLLSFLILSAGISVVIAQENIFTVRQPDYQKSPYTGMTRRHWIQAGEYLLKGAFDYIHTCLLYTSPSPRPDVFPETAGKDISAK